MQATVAATLGHALMYNVLITPLLMISLIQFIALSIGLIYVISKLKFVVNSQLLFFNVEMFHM